MKKSKWRIFNIPNYMLQGDVYSQLVRQPTGPSRLMDRRNNGLGLGLKPLILLNLNFGRMIIGLGLG